MPGSCAEIDENIHRNNLSAAQETKALARRKYIYLALHPETARGAAGGHGKHHPATENISFAEDTAAKTGKTSRSIRSDVALGEKLDDEAVEIIEGTPVADNKSEAAQKEKGRKNLPTFNSDKLAATAKQDESARTTALARWIDCNQLGRRNLSPDQMSLLRGRRYNRSKKSHGGTGANQHKQKPQSEVSANTAETLAAQHGVSKATIERDGQYAAAVAKLGLDAEVARGEVDAPRSAIVEAARAIPEDAQSAFDGGRAGEGVLRQGGQGEATSIGRRPQQKSGCGKFATTGFH